MRSVTTVLAALLGALALASPAQADDTPATFTEPAVVVPLVTQHVQVQAPRAAWGIRQAARRMDAALPGITISVRGRCNPLDYTTTCVRVRMDRYSVERQHQLAQQPVEWMGLTAYPAAGLRVVYLNRTYYRHDREAIAAHELGHVLGLNHHDRAGVCGRWPDRHNLSVHERRALNSRYSTPVQQRAGAWTVPAPALHPVQH